jgi:hypothetical protein
MIRHIPFVVVLLLMADACEAKLIVKVETPKEVGKRAHVRLTVKNTFTNKLESARATIFLLNDEEKVVGQKSEWIIGGAKEKPGLAPDASTTYNFVLPADKPFTKTKLIVNRIVLDGSKQVDPIQGAEILK